LAAAFGTPSAGFGTFPHWNVIAAELFATASTALARLSANATRVRVQLRTSQHEIGGSEAHLRAIFDPPDMISFGMLAGLFEAVLNGFRANGVTTGAIVNAGLNVCLAWHRFSLLGNWTANHQTRRKGSPDQCSMR
jgi:hypothetical protein